MVHAGMVHAHHGNNALIAKYYSDEWVHVELATSSSSSSSFFNTLLMDEYNNELINYYMKKRKNEGKL
ncbi:hypothetical protein BLOT_013795 [Blomia tropicalis]|nr:hypothetical protein BLOT_013795 [Blomia tropicalis]